MYKYRRIQMYLVFVRILFTLFLIFLIIMSIVHCVQDGNIGILLLKILVMAVAYIINVVAYHKSMDNLELHFQELKKIVDDYDEKVGQELTPGSDDTDENKE